MSRESITQLQEQVLAARDQLLALRRDDVGWAYGSNGAAYTEPTAVGALALLATRDALQDAGLAEVVNSEETDELVQQSAAWLETLQQLQIPVPEIRHIWPGGWPHFFFR